MLLLACDSRVIIWGRSRGAEVLGCRTVTLPSRYTPSCSVLVRVPITASTTSLTVLSTDSCINKIACTRDPRSLVCPKLTVLLAELVAVNEFVAVDEQPHDAVEIMFYNGMVIIVAERRIAHPTLEFISGQS